MEAMKMMINITTPKKIPYFQILLRTKKYYHLDALSDVIQDKTRGYYIFIRKRNIQIKLFRYNDEAVEDIQNYLNYTFKNSYLGIQENGFDILKLQEVNKIRM